MIQILVSMVTAQTCLLTTSVPASADGEERIAISTKVVILAILIHAIPTTATPIRASMASLTLLATAVQVIKERTAA